MAIFWLCNILLIGYFALPSAFANKIASLYYTIESVRGISLLCMAYLIVKFLLKTP